MYSSWDCLTEQRGRYEVSPYHKATAIMELPPPEQQHSSRSLKSFDGSFQFLFFPLSTFTYVITAAAVS